MWLQSPHNAERFQQAGINLYIGLWSGPTEEQYLLTSNESPNPATAMLQVMVPLADGAQLKPIANESPLEMRDAKIRLELPGYGIGLYRLDESSPRP